MYNMDFNIFEKYFSGCFDAGQNRQFEALSGLYADWNAKINVISRKDIDNLFLHHVVHSLSIYGFLGSLKSGTSFLDMGTGGGFPGIPLAIAYPECRFLLVDRIAKKIRVAQDVADSIGLNNVVCRQGDIGEIRDKYDYVVSRAVMRLDLLVPLVRKNVSATSKNTYANGLVCLKGGDIEAESVDLHCPVLEYPVTEFVNDPFFETKKLVYVPI